MNQSLFSVLGEALFHWLILGWVVYVSYQVSQILERLDKK